MVGSRALNLEAFVRYNLLTGSQFRKKSQVSDATLYLTRMDEKLEQPSNAFDCSNHMEDLVALPRYDHEAGKLIIRNYLKIGANDEAQQAAKSTARIFCMF